MSAEDHASPTASPGSGSGSGSGSSSGSGSGSGFVYASASASGNGNGIGHGYGYGHARGSAPSAVTSPAMPSSSTENGKHARRSSVTARRVLAPVTWVTLSTILAACGSESPGPSSDGGSSASGAALSAQGEVSATPPALGSASELAGGDTVTLSDAQALAARLAAAAAEATDEPRQPDSPTSGSGQVSISGSADVDSPASVNSSASGEESGAEPAVAAALPEAPVNPLAVVEEEVETDDTDTVQEGGADTGSQAGSGGETADASQPTSQTDAAAEADTGADTVAESELAPSESPGSDTATGADQNSDVEAQVDSGSDNASAGDTGAGSSGNADADAGANTPSGATDGSGTAESSGSQQRRFESRNTAGFTGELLDDGTVRVRWPEDPGARGYNVYRDADYFTTVYTNEFIDDDIHDRSYYYEIQAFDFDEKFTTIAIGLTVTVSGLGRVDPDAPVPNTSLLDNYDLVFADEFDTGVLDPTKWNSAFLWGPDLTINSEEQYYVDILREPDFGYDPFTFENGALVINSIRTPDALRSKARNQPYLSGLITSYDSFKFTYGYVEARARMPFGKGLWPAFWLLNAYYVDDEPEIDIVEFIGDNQDTAYHTYHYYDENGELRSTKSKPTTGTDWTADFHTYGVDWRPGLLVFYIDRIEVHRISDPKVSRQDMYIIANTALGGWWAGSPNETTVFPTRYELDYIRVYRQTQPYNDPPFSDGASAVELATQVPGASPAHRPPPELWPDGYPGRQPGTP